jgi:hypothetical protein
MLRSLTVLLGCAFFLRFIALESLYAPGRGVIKRLMTALMEGITLGALDYVPAGSPTGYVAFLTLTLYLMGLVLLPAGGYAASGTLEVIPMNGANERPRVSLASGAGRGAPASEPVGGLRGAKPHGKD